jgi:DNA mismatch repair protein MSH5
MGFRAQSSLALSVSSGPPQTPINSSASKLRTPCPTDTKLETDRSARVTDDDLDAHVIAAIDTKENATLGCAYYSAEEEKMHLFSDSRLGGIETIDACRS